MGRHTLLGSSSRSFVNRLRSQAAVKTIRSFCHPCTLSTYHNVSPSTRPVLRASCLGSTISKHRNLVRTIMEPAKLRRHEERAKYDVDSLQSVFSDTFLSHVSYVDDGLPQCLPMIALFRSEGEGQDPVVYLHGHPSARLMEIVRNQEKDRESHQGSTIDGEPDARFRVCIAATKGKRHHTTHRSSIRAVTDQASYAQSMVLCSHQHLTGIPSTIDAA